MPGWQYQIAQYIARVRCADCVTVWYTDGVGEKDGSERSGEIMLQAAMYGAYAEYRQISGVSYNNAVGYALIGRHIERLAIGCTANIDTLLGATWTRDAESAVCDERRANGTYGSSAYPNHRTRV